MTKWVLCHPRRHASGNSAALDLASDDHDTRDLGRFLLLRDDDGDDRNDHAGDESYSADPAADEHKGRTLPIFRRAFTVLCAEAKEKEREKNRESVRKIS